MGPLYEVLETRQYKTSRCQFILGVYHGMLVYTEIAFQAKISEIEVKALSNVFCVAVVVQTWDERRM